MQKVTWRDLMDAALVDEAYDTWSGRASALLGLVDFEVDRLGKPTQKNAPRKREEHVEYLITHGVTCSHGRQKIVPPLGVDITDERYNEIAVQIVLMVNQLSAMLLKKNETPRKTARKILTFLDGLSGQEAHVVALALLLRQPIIPYVRIPPAYLDVGPIVPPRFSQRLVQSVFILGRVMRDVELSPHQRFTVIERIFRRHGRARDRHILFFNLVMLTEKEVLHRVRHENIMKMYEVQKFFDALKRGEMVSGTALPEELRAFLDGQSDPFATKPKNKPDKPS